MRSRGVALVAALLVVAIAASLASQLLWRNSLWIGEVEALRDLAQARRHADAAAEWACAVLADDAANSAIDHAQEAWARKIPPMDAEGGRIGGLLADEQVRWNLNNLVVDGKINDAELALYRRLLSRLGLPEDLADALADWMDGDNESRPGGAEDAYYLARSPSTRTAGTVLGAWEDLLLVKGYDAKVLERLQLHATVLPANVPVNLNGASAELLAAIYSGLSVADAEQLALQGQRVPYRDAADFRARLGKDLPSDGDNRVATRSRYFSLYLSVAYGRSAIEMRALIDRGRGWPVVVRKRFG